MLGIFSAVSIFSRFLENSPDTWKTTAKLHSDSYLSIRHFTTGPRPLIRNSRISVSTFDSLHWRAVLLEERQFAFLQRQASLIISKACRFSMNCDWHSCFDTKTRERGHKILLVSLRVPKGGAPGSFILILSGLFLSVDWCLWSVLSMVN